MRLVVDTNVLFSFFRESPVREVVVNSTVYGLELFAPEYAIGELEKNVDSLSRFSGLGKREIISAILALRTFVEVKPMEFFSEFKGEAEKACPDKKDSPFFALAMKLNSGVWSLEPRLKRQQSVKVFNTKEVLEMIEFSK